MKIRTLLFVGLLAMSVMGPVKANTPGNLLGACMVDNLNGKERRYLARWLIFSISVHPDIKQHFNVTQKDVPELDKYVGKLVTRLLSEDCPNEAKNAASTDPLAMERAFEITGQVAADELTRNQDVTKSLNNWVQYADLPKLQKIFGK